MQFCYWIRLLLDQVTCQMHMFASNCIWAKLSFASRSSLCQVSERIGLFEHNKLLSGPVASFDIRLCTSFCVIDSHWSHTQHLAQATAQAIRLTIELDLSEMLQTGTWKMGLQVSKEQFDKILQMCKQGEEQGAKLECGGKRLGDKGYYIEPTVFSNVQDDNIIATDEIFGPVQSILKWSTIDEVRQNRCVLHSN